MEKNLKLLAELIENQKKTLLALAVRVVPGITDDDLLQPNDFPILENHPEFRYEEGVLHGFLAAFAALQFAAAESFTTKGVNCE